MKPRLYFDEDIKPDAAVLLQAAGFDVLTARDAGRLGLLDTEQFEFAISEGRVFVTYNFHDFEEIAQQALGTGRVHRGIIVSYHQYDNDQVGWFARMLIELLEARTADDMRSAYLILPRPKFA